MERYINKTSVKRVIKNNKIYRITFKYVNQFPKVEIKVDKRFIGIEDYYHKLNNFLPPKNIPEFLNYNREMALQDLGKEYMLELILYFYKKNTPTIDTI